MLLPETELSQARQLAERLRLSIEVLSFRDGRKTFRVSASFGIAELGMHSQIDELIAEADDWLYRAKQGGRNRVAGAPQNLAGDLRA
ncbi:diguanylate cyclase [Dechloromonas sp.]|uniref:diguanylate cyclase n=1 Tax=Dechloromonas sp. TaxID=1917218 RepID=UPI0012123202|nr:diguanylate cyclase [Dechloromonas sp.]MBU3698201.1 diguanylate cyclase [Dechloromonas sp.]TEX47459.1 MAG: GGDEF domain-containing protein [Rhodocyclaceae bacterium]